MTTVATTANDSGTGVVIVGAARTPIGSLGGGLSDLSASALGGAAIKSAVLRSGVSPESVERCFMGHVLSAGEGQSPVRQAASAGGLPDEVVCVGVDKVCASGMKAVVLAAMEIQLGIAEVAVAGGMESMSGAPHLVRETRFGHRLGNCEMVDSLISDGLTDGILGCHMGMHAENCAVTFGISREYVQRPPVACGGVSIKDQDEFAHNSYSKGIEARDTGCFNWEIAPIEGKDGVLIKNDEELERTARSSLSEQPPAFKKDLKCPGTVTAGNASPLSDGAAALVLMSRKKAKELGLRPIAHILGYGDAETTPEQFTIAPSLSLPIALRNACMKTEDVDLFELNEAFAVVALANAQLMKLDPGKVNVFGGAVSLGHPLGCSGARIIVTLINALQTRNKWKGAAAVCNGGGGSSAIVIERL